MPDSGTPVLPQQTRFGWHRDAEPVAPELIAKPQMPVSPPPVAVSKPAQVPSILRSSTPAQFGWHPEDSLFQSPVRPDSPRPLTTAPKPSITQTGVFAAITPVTQPVLTRKDEHGLSGPQGASQNISFISPARPVPRQTAFTRTALVAATVAAVASSTVFVPAIAGAASHDPAQKTGQHPIVTASSHAAIVSNGTAASTPLYTGEGGAPGINYTVKVGDTLHDIAAQYGVSTTEIIQANNLANPDLIFPGDHVNIPAAGGAKDVTVEVKPGDTINKIAEQYGVDSSAIVNYAANKISNANLIVVGQTLTIPGTTSAPAAQETSSADTSAAADVTVEVKAGDTLADIATRYGVNASAIATYASNKISNPNVIVVGQKLTIPGAKTQPSATVQAAAPESTSAPQTVTTDQSQASDQSATEAAPAATQPAPAATQTPAPTPAPTQAPAPAATQGFVWPTQGTITQNFGPTSFGLEPAYQGYAHFHQGVDIANAMYTPIRAAEAGTVIFAGWSNYGYGFCVQIDHGNGLVTLYGHMAQQPSVSVGEQVATGQAIGKMGSTGASTGSHLHFAVQKNGVWVNPLNYLP